LKHEIFEIRTPVTDIRNHPLKSTEKLLKLSFGTFPTVSQQFPQISLPKIPWIFVCNPKTYEAESARMDLSFLLTKSCIFGAYGEPLMKETS
jgi:hypothetical protein